MSNYWDGEWPNLNSVSVAVPIMLSVGVPPIVTGIIYRLVSYIASRSVSGAYHEPDLDPSLPANPKELAKYAGCSKRELSVALPYLETIFETRGGRLRLIDESIIRYTRPLARQAIAKDAKAAVAAREGLRCVYCGTIQGPFHYDHIFPVARGGRNDVSNLVVACQPCNNSKKDKTLAEWMASGGPPRSIG